MTSLLIAFITVQAMFSPSAAAESLTPKGIERVQNDIVCALVPESAYQLVRPLYPHMPDTQFELCAVIEVEQ
tara:strand:- start:15184 stop:15399 length:216 start_codon:yes stop_codon:yes gene_type:complete